MYSRKLKFCVFLGLVSLFSAFLYIDSFAPSSPIPSSRIQPTVYEWKGKESFAYATFLGPPTSGHISEDATAPDTASDLLHDPYFVSVRLLNYQINHAEKTRTSLNGVPFLVLVLPQVPAAQTAVLEAEGATIVSIEPLDLPDAFDKNFIENSRFRDVLSKLRLWQLTNYDKVLYLDADAFLLANLDSIFTDPALSTTMKTLAGNDTTNRKQGTKSVQPPAEYLMAASTDTYGDQTPWESPDHVNYLCACFMLFAPSTALFNYYISVLTGPDAPPNAAYPEQDLLIYVHRADGPMPWRRIPIAWSANDGEMNDELALRGGVKSLHVKGWDGAEGGNVASEKYRGVWKELVREMEEFYNGTAKG